MALQDPYCAWDKIAGKCRSHGAPRWIDETYFYSEVSTGQHSACPSGKTNKDPNVESKGYRDDFDMRMGNAFLFILLYFSYACMKEIFKTVSLASQYFFYLLETDIQVFYCFLAPIQCALVKKL